MRLRFVLKRRPRAYPATQQQVNFRKALEYCEIRKGMPKAELQEKMKNCLPEFYARLKEGRL
jgi:hypothetical protein